MKNRYIARLKNGKLDLAVRHRPMGKIHRLRFLRRSA